MTEFIIVFPVLFILIFAAFQFTLLYHAKNYIKLRDLSCCSIRCS